MDRFKLYITNQHYSMIKSVNGAKTIILRLIAPFVLINCICCSDKGANRLQDATIIRDEWGERKKP